MSFYVKKLSPDAVIPVQASSGSAGRDLSSIEDSIIPAGKWKAISTGLAIAIPNDHYARIAPRSGLAFNRGIFVNAGVVDSDYRGELKVILYNAGDEDFIINKFDRIAQVVFEKIYNGELIEVPDLFSTSRGENGFGSSGK